MNILTKIPVMAGFLAGSILPFNSVAQQADEIALANTILSDRRLDSVQDQALQLLKGMNAGTSYREVWIRDLNTFIRGSLRVLPKEEVKAALLLFFSFQEKDGNIVDGMVEKKQARGGYAYRYSALAPDWAAHKNTVETDQETSLVQAVKKYIEVSGDTAILSEQPAGRPVIRCMEQALEYVMQHRWSPRYGLVTGATTIDWGDVQPEKGWGVAINEHTKWSIDIYDNAMFVMAIHDLLSMLPPGYRSSRNWQATADSIRRNARRYLWMVREEKYRPHLYLEGSPFSPSFREEDILYTGGTTCAILAGFHSKEEIAAINRQMLKAAATQPFATIGITVYPPYPASEFPNMPPYTYQNAGDWTWFGGRMIQALVANGMVKEAWQEIGPMIDRVLRHKGFYEWYNVRTGAPSGSGSFRGEAGVLYDAILQLQQWAKQTTHP